MSNRKAWRQSSQESRQKRGYGREHERIRAELIRTVILCEHCTAKGKVAQGCIADHIIPLAKGGTGDRSNYQWLCQECADVKDAADRGVIYRPKRQIAPDGWPVE